MSRTHQRGLQTYFNLQSLFIRSISLVLCMFVANTRAFVQRPTIAFHHFNKLQPFATFVRPFQASASSSLLQQLQHNSSNSSNMTAAVTASPAAAAKASTVHTVSAAEHHHHQQQQQQQQDAKPILAKIIRPTPENIAACANRLAAGDLVAFPTETVYGLGCHALDVEAVQKVFAAKQRPLTDPLIVHVNHVQDAMKLWDQDDPFTSKALQVLCDAFWPGPLTLVAKATATGLVPDKIMAATGYVACRSPRHALARTLIDATGHLPLAAPSANTFGHVSPTTAQHVYDDLKYENVWILQQQLEENDEPGENTVTCQVGVESTVAKVESVHDYDGNAVIVVTVLRQGAVSVQEIENALQKQLIIHHHDDSSMMIPFRVQAQLKRATTDHVANVAPGQTIRHYSPHVASFLVSPTCMSQQQPQSLLERTVVIDYGQTLLQWKSHALAYRDLSPVADPAQAAQCIFDTLRWAEQVNDATAIVFPQIQTTNTLLSSEQDYNRNALLLAIQDRLTRAASGVVIDSLQEIQQRRDVAEQE